MGALADLIADASALLARVEELESEASDARVTVAVLEDELRDASTEIARLEGEIVRLSSLPLPSGAVSGLPAPLGDLPGWRQIFVDDFTTNVPLGQFPSAVSSKWRAYPPPGQTYRDTSKVGVYDPAKTISIADSVMKIHMFSDASGVVRVAAPVPLIHPPAVGELWPGQLYGRYAFRARFLHPAPGFKVAWMTWPDRGTNTTGSPSGVGGNGENDFVECNLDTLNKVGAFMHRQDATLGNDQYSCSIGVDMTQWHTYVLEWSKDLWVVKCDDVEFGRTAVRVPSTSMHCILQCETNLSGAKPPVASTADIEIDWAAVWAYAP